MKQSPAMPGPPLSCGQSRQASLSTWWPPITNTWLLRLSGMAAQVARNTPFCLFFFVSCLKFAYIWNENNHLSGVKIQVLSYPWWVGRRGLCYLTESTLPTIVLLLKHLLHVSKRSNKKLLDYFYGLPITSDDFEFIWKGRNLNN